MPEDKVLIERERIKAVIKRKKEEIEKICEGKKRYRRNIPRYKILRLFDDVIFWIDNPDYIRVKDRVSTF